MFKKIAMPLAIAAFMGLAGCSQSAKEPTVDTSTEQSAEASVKHILETLPEDKKVQFQNAMENIVQTEVMSMISQPGVNPADLSEDKLKQKLDEMFNGLTAQQIIEKSDKLKQQHADAQPKTEAPAQEAPAAPAPKGDQ